MLIGLHILAQILVKAQRNEAEDPFQIVAQYEAEIAHLKGRLEAMCSGGAVLEGHDPLHPEVTPPAFLLFKLLSTVDCRLGRSAGGKCRGRTRTSEGGRGLEGRTE